QLLTAAGYQQYETSAYAKPGYQCQHNLNYWRFGDYLGVGCGAREGDFTVGAAMHEALEDARKQTVSTLIDIKVLPKTMVHKYLSWWRVGGAQVSR
ncbi:hypothetical protein MJN51_30450, partial [Salmonella enterica subsp. enterica serovar Kentucky]|nr:hypothetical protein [Salmonella enterica subsp. enterica serovar Kentucky]